MRDFLLYRVTVATVHGPSYYNITSALKLMDLQFESLSPEEAAISDSKIIITTEKEADIVRRKDVILDTDLAKYPVVVKARILKNIAGEYADDQLTIGVDPGTRIGISAIYLHNEIESLVASSPESTVDHISVMLAGIESRKKIVKIGDGNMEMAIRIASEIRNRFSDVEIEIVDERGTSLPPNIEINRRGARDRSSARTIAFRIGKNFASK